MSSEPTTQVAPCNGLVSNCDMRVNELLFPMVHNAMSSQANNFVAYNNLGSLEDALTFGYRGLALDSCDCSTNGQGNLGLQLCHGECYFQDIAVLPIGWRSPIEVFENILTFLNQNPNEVLILDIQANDNTLTDLYTNVLSNIDGFIDLMYKHPIAAAGEDNTNDEWPLMSELIESNQRIIFFAACSENPDDDSTPSTLTSCPSTVNSIWRHVFDTPYYFTKEELVPSDGNYYDTSCIKDRGSTSGGHEDFYLSNHFANNADTQLPDETISEEINQYTILKERHEQCSEKFNNKQVNILMVDFWSIHGNDILTYTNEQNIQRYNDKFGIIVDEDNNNGIGDGGGGDVSEPTMVPTTIMPSPLATMAPTTIIPSSSPTKATVEETNVTPKPSTTTIASPASRPTTGPTILTTSVPTTDASGVIPTNSPTIDTDGGGASWLDSTAESIKAIATNNNGDDGNSSTTYTIIVASSILVGALLLCILMICCRRRRARAEAAAIRRQQQYAQQQCRNSATSSFSSYDW